MSPRSLSCVHLRSDHREESRALISKFVESNFKGQAVWFHSLLKKNPVTASLQRESTRNLCWARSVTSICKLSVDYGADGTTSEQATCFNCVWRAWFASLTWWRSKILKSMMVPPSERNSIDEWLIDDEWQYEQSCVKDIPCVDILCELSSSSVTLSTVYPQYQSETYRTVMKTISNTMMVATEEYQKTKFSEAYKNWYFILELD